MPFRVKARKVWRGQVRSQGKTYWSDFSTKSEAADWEAGVRAELKKAKARGTTTLTDMDWLTFSNAYLDEAELRFTPKVYKAKAALVKRLTLLWDNPLVCDITPDMVRTYLNSRAKASASRYNEDRKRMHAMWTWGMNILDLRSNPVAKLRRLPHDRAPQYTPPTKDVLKVLAACTREERILMIRKTRGSSIRGRRLFWGAS